ncbi:TAXI family TRAP transporter solute-binding subunit [Fodinicurvata sp. EGI_FJ10296]|uniref:TAXI family TRAP transporter solute-binding subunit n=1 Tax=Fodinicurvata sp. EGI_FJ10296 TaxID=3231908 RepID=UPI0034565186
MTIRKSAQLFAATALGTALIAGGAAAQDIPSEFSVGTASQGGTYFVYGAGWANLVAEELGISASSEVTGGPVQNATLVQTGDLDMSMVTMGPAWEALQGESELAPGLEHTELRAVFPMYQTPFHVVTLAGSGIESLSDLDGLTVGVGPAGGTPGTYFPRFFDILDIEVEVRYGGASDLAGQLQDGLIDAFAFAAGIPIAAFSQVEAQTDAHIFGFTDEEVETLTAEYPYVLPLTIPADTYVSQEEDFQSVAMWNFAVAHADVSEDLVYETTRIVMENHDRMMEIHAASAETLPENYDKNTFLTWHPGAVRWFEENGYEIDEDLK